MSQRQYELVTGYKYSGSGTDGSKPAWGLNYCKLRGTADGAKWPESSEVDGESFVGKLRARTGLNIDLPTEAQWECACRAGSVKDKISKEYVHNDRLVDWHYGVCYCGTLKPNEWGLYDMLGNVSELCLDWYAEELQYGLDPRGANSGEYRVYRGGSAYFMSYPSSGLRESRWPGADEANTSYSGFRLACNPEKSCSQMMKVTYDANGGATSIKSQTVAVNDCLHSMPVADGASAFEGWYTESDGGVRITAGTSIMSNMTLYARWKSTDNATDLPAITTGTSCPVSCGNGLVGGSSKPVKIDLTTGARMAAKTEPLAYSTEWGGNAGVGAVAVVAIDGKTLSSESGSGIVEWTPTRDGTYELTHTVVVDGTRVDETLTVAFIVKGVKPDISPASGTTFEESMTITISCLSEGATIHYTTNGLTPTAESTTYARKFRIYGKTTVKAVAFYEDGTTSEVAVAEYAKWRDDPVIRPKDGTVFEHSGQRVSITHEVEDGVVRYTTDGSEPTADSAVYVGPFAIDETTTVKAKLFGDQCFDSDVLTATLTRVWVPAATPVIAAAPSFTGSKQKVVLSCATAGAAIYYTTDGSEPTPQSARYGKPFYVTDSATVKAYAVMDDYLDSDVATLEIVRAWGIGDTMGKPDHAFETGGNAGFVRVEDVTATLGESMRSGEIKNCQTSVLSTVVVGPGTLTFKWKTSCEEDEYHEWDHAEFAVDGEVIKVLDGETDWIEVSQRIEGDCEHTVTWAYVKDDVEAAGEDCLWVSEYAWATDYTETQTTDVPVPYNWLREKSRDIVDEYDNYERVAKQTAYNGRLTVEQCYVAGVEPESATNDFRTVIEMVDGVPHVTWEPDKKAEREYKIWGSETIEGGGDWHSPTNALDRFFKVTVEMP